MLSKNQLVLMAFLFASFGLSLPINPVGSDIEVHSSVVGDDVLSTLDVTEVDPYLTIRDEEYSDLEAQDEEYSTFDTRDVEEYATSEAEAEAEPEEDQLSSLQERKDPAGGKKENASKKQKQI